MLPGTRHVLTLPLLDDLLVELILQHVLELSQAAAHPQPATILVVLIGTVVVPVALSGHL